LHDHRPRQDLVTLHDVANVQIHEIAATPFAVDGKIEHGQIAGQMFSETLGMSSIGWNRGSRGQLELEALNA